MYPDIDQFWADLKSVYAQEVEALGKLGCTYLQMDDTSLAYLNDPTQRDYVAKLGGDAENQHLVYIDLINGALARKPAGHGGVHAPLPRQLSFVVGGLGRLRLRGRGAVQRAQRGRLLPGVRRRALRRLRAAALRAEGQVRGARPRSPRSARQLEKKDDIKRRIEQAAKFVPMDQICLSPQCGFSSTLEGNAVTLDDQIAKLRLVTEVAREVWG